MILMLILRLGVDQNVVYKDLDELMKIGLEYLMHDIHECFWRIRQSEGHHPELKVPISRPERCLRDISLPNSQLMVTGAE